MKLTILPLTLLVSMAVTGTAQDSKFPSLPSEVFSNYAPQVPEIHSPGAMAAQAQTFLDSLDDNGVPQSARPAPTTNADGGDEDGDPWQSVSPHTSR